MELGKEIRYLCAHLLILLLAVNIVPAEAVTIISLSQNSATIGRYEKFEATFTLDQNYANPFEAFCEQWLGPGIDLDGDGGSSDFGDFGVLAGYWAGRYPVGWPF